MIEHGKAICVKLPTYSVNTRKYAYAFTEGKLYNYIIEVIKIDVTGNGMPKQIEVKIIIKDNFNFGQTFSPEIMHDCFRKFI